MAEWVKVFGQTGRGSEKEKVIVAKAAETQEYLAQVKTEKKRERGCSCSLKYALRLLHRRGRGTY